MNTYKITFNGQFQGVYKGSSAAVALTRWEMDYKTTILRAFDQFNAWPEIVKTKSCATCR